MRHYKWLKCKQEASYSRSRRESKRFFSKTTNEKNIALYKYSCFYFLSNKHKKKIINIFYTCGSQEALTKGERISGIRPSKGGTDPLKEKIFQTSNGTAERKVSCLPSPKQNLQTLKEEAAPVSA